MGGCMPEGIPKQIMSMPKSTEKPNLDIQYNSESGGLPKAQYIEKVIKTVYPKANVNLNSSEIQDNLLVKNGQDKVYDKKEDGQFNSQTAMTIIQKIGSSIAK